MSSRELAVRPWHPPASVVPLTTTPPPTAPVPPTLEEVVAEAVTVAEARAAAAAFAKGHAAGRAEGEKVGYAAGERAGILATEASLEARYDAELARVLGSFTEAARAWHADAAHTRDGIGHFLQAAAIEVASWALGESIAHSPDRLASRVGALVDHLGPLDRASLVLNPHDLGALKALPTWGGFVASVPELSIETDAQMERGTLRLASPLHYLEMHWPDRLQALRETLHREN